MSDNFKEASNDANAQIAQLKEQVQTLMNERVSPAISQAADSAKQSISQAADTAKQYAHDAREIYDDQAEALSERIREAPVVALLIAAGAGYVLGRIAR